MFNEGLMNSGKMTFNKLQCLHVWKIKHLKHSSVSRTTFHRQIHSIQWVYMEYMQIVWSFYLVFLGLAYHSW